jgi:hypothetical protein
MTFPRERKFPRIPFSSEGKLEYLDRKRGRIQLSATITSIACEGLGLTVNPPVELARRSRVTVVFPLADRQLSLPGVVAWSRGGGVGVHLLLELALPAARQQWAHWIVEQTTEFRTRQRRESGR